MLQLRVNLMDPFFPSQVSGITSVDSFFYLFIKKKIFYSCPTWHVGFNFPDRDETCTPCIESTESYYWTTREVPHYSFLYLLLLNSFAGLC